MVTLQFSTERAIDSAIIRFLTWSDISHVDIVEPVTGQLLGARLHGGVQLRPVDYSSFHKVIRAEIELPNLAAEQAVLSAARSQIGKPYDWTGILNFGFQRNWREEDSWFCSEFVAWSFEKAGYALLNVGAEVWRITPRDLLLSPVVIVCGAACSRVIWRPSLV